MGRAAFVYHADTLKGRWIGEFDAELAREFFGGFVSTALCNLHLEVRYGENAHHIVEALFKAFARATRRRGHRRARGRHPFHQGHVDRVSVIVSASLSAGSARHGNAGTGRPRVVIVDTGSGNLRSVEKAIAVAGGDPLVTGDADAVAAADKIVVPGQGHFRACITGLGVTAGLCGRRC